MNLDNHAAKAIICDIYVKAVEEGEIHQPINKTDGPSKKFMGGFYLKRWSAKYVDSDCIIMANKDTITDYFKLLIGTLVKFDIVKHDSKGEVRQESMNQERVYLADKTVIGCNGAKHVYFRKANDESHNTLMLGICGNGEVIKPLIILEKSLPFVRDGESNHILQKTLLCKSNKGSVEKRCFLSVAWK